MSELLYYKQYWVAEALRFANHLVNFLANSIPGWGWWLGGIMICFFLVLGGRLKRIGPEESSIYLSPVRVFGRLSRWVAGLSLVSLILAFVFVWLVLTAANGVQAASNEIMRLLSAFWPDRLEGFALGFGVGLVVGLIARWWLIGRLLEPWINKKLERHTRQRRKQDRLSDIRSIARELPDSQQSYDPRAYYKPNVYFIGLDEHKEPVYISFDAWYSSHKQYKGATRTGKGLAAGNTGAQGVGFGDSVIVLDPKGDRWLPHVMRTAAEEADVGFHLLDLRPGTPAQFNILFDTNAAELELLLDAGLGFEETGSKGSDYYSKVDRRTLRRSVKLVDGLDISLPEMCARVRAEWEDLEKENSGFLLALEEVADLSCLHTRRGLDFEAAIRDGDVIYVIGDMLNTRVVKLQKMLLLRLLQLVNRREDSEGHRPVTIYLDEFKYFLSRIALNALGTVLHKGCNVVLSHQTDGDLRACPGIDPDEVTGVVQANAQIRVFYRQDLPEDAQRAAAMTGLKIIDKERRKVGRNEELAEVVDPERLVDEVQIPLFDTNIIQSLPPRCAVVFTPGEMARIAITAPYPCERKPLSITKAPALPLEEARLLEPEGLI